MKNKKIVIAGGTGFIGYELVRYFGADNQLILLTRHIPDARNNRNHYSSLTAEQLSRIQFVKWSGLPNQNNQPDDKLVAALENADLLINLAGKTVNCRYTSANKREILDSRTNAVAALGQAIRQCKQAPTTWMNASSATIYRHALDRPQDEKSGEHGTGFSVMVCEKWEESFYAEATPQTRKIALRMAITLGTGGVLIPYFRLLKFGLGGKQGNGQQYFSWIHIEDTCRIIDWLMTHPQLEGSFNCAAPNPIPNVTFTRALRQVTGQRFGLPAPAWLLKIGAVLIGTETELVLKSRWVIPTRLLDAGFTFKYPIIDAAFEDIIKRVPRKQYHLF